MPVLESTDHTDHITPRSVLRHRPIADDAEKQKKRVTAPSVIAPVAQRASRLRSKQTEESEPEKDTRDTQDDDDIEEWKRADSDGGKPNPAHASSAQPAGVTGTKKVPKIARPTSANKKLTSPRKWFAPRAHPLLFLGLGMISMLILWTMLTLVTSWWNTTWDDIHYGRPRTFQTDVAVGHNDSTASPSHFIAINLNGRIEVIEFPGGDASKARIYIGPQLYGSGDALIPVTLSFVDVSGNHQPDMIIHFQDTRIVYINAQGGFRPANPTELHTVEQYLQQHNQ